jgi:hypothetical protein
VEKKFFKKSKMAAGIKKTRLSRHFGFFEKLFFHKTCVLVTPNEPNKKIEKMLDTLRGL